MHYLVLLKSFFYDIFSDFWYIRTSKNLTWSEARCPWDASYCWLWAYRMTFWYGWHICHAVFFFFKSHSSQSFWSRSWLLSPLKWSYLSYILCSFGETGIFSTRRTLETPENRLSSSRTSEAQYPLSRKFFVTSGAWTFSSGGNRTFLENEWKTKRWKFFKTTSYLLYVWWWTSRMTDMGSGDVCCKISALKSHCYHGL